jgi:hypothetical protein
MGISRFSCLVLSSVLLFACSSAQRDWSRAITQNTVAGYESYLGKYPNSDHAGEARERIHSHRHRRGMPTRLAHTSTIWSTCPAQSTWQRRVTRWRSQNARRPGSRCSRQGLQRPTRRSWRSMLEVRMPIRRE